MNKRLRGVRDNKITYFHNIRGMTYKNRRLTRKIHLNMRVITVLFVIGQAFSAELHSTSRLETALSSKCAIRKLYSEYKQTHGHTRPPHEEKLRLDMFEREIREILELRNNPGITWDVGVNLMADMTHGEKDLMLGVNGSVLANSNPRPRLKAMDPTKSIPVAFNFWRDENLVGDVRKQLKGSCWAHASTGVIQALLAARSGNLDELSVQEVYDCADDVKLVRYGGFMDKGFDYPINNGRMGFEVDSPETPAPGGSGTDCKTYKNKRNALAGYKVTNREGLEATDNDLRYHVCYVSPVAANIGTKADQLDKYKGKLYTPQNCGDRADHSIVVIGYTRDTYIIKNSWGLEWGTGGYMNWDRNGKTCFLLNYMMVAYMEPKDGSEDKSSSWDRLWPFNWGSKKRTMIE